jgi:hypothetical protein
MSQRTRIVVAIIVLLALVGGVLAVDALQRTNSGASATSGVPTVPAGNIPVYVDAQLAGSFGPDDLAALTKVSFVEPVDGQTEEGWLLRDALLLVVDRATLRPETRLVVISSSRGKQAEVTWAEADNPDNFVMFDLSNRGTLKLASVLPKLDTREEWVQDVDRVEILTR